MNGENNKYMNAEIMNEVNNKLQPINIEKKNDDICKFLAR